MFLTVLLVFVFLSVLATPTTILSVKSTTETTYKVTIENVDNLFGYDIQISWNPTVLSLEQATIMPVWNEYFIAKDNISEGSYRLVVVSTKDAFTGSATLFTLEFGSVGYGETTINFTIVKLADDHWQPIPAQLEPYPYIKKPTLFDMQEMATYLGTANPQYDLNSDGIIDVLDLRILAEQIK